MKKSAVYALSGIFTLLILIAVAAVAIPYLVDVNQHKGKISEQIAQTTGLTVTFDGDLSLDMFPVPHVTAQNVIIQNPEGFSSTHLARVETLDIYVALAPLLSKTVDVQSVSLIKPDINLETNASAQSNWSVKQSENENDETDVTQNDHTPTRKTTLTIRTIDITDGQIHIIKPKADTLTISDINIKMNADTLQGPFDAKGNANAFKQQFDFDTQIEAFETLDAALPIALKLKVSPANVSVKYNGVVDMKALEAQGRIDTQFPNGALKGMINASKTEARITDMQPKIADYDAAGSAQVKTDPMTLTAKLNTQGRTVDVAAVLTETLNIVASADVIDFDALMTKKSKPLGDKATKPSDKSDTKSNIPFPVNFDITIDKAIYNTHPIQGVTAKGTLKGDTLRIGLASVENFSGLNAQASGLINNIKSLSGIDMKASGSIKDVKQFTTALKQNPQAIPQAIDTASFDMALTSLNGKNLNAKGTIKALGGTFAISTLINDLQTSPAVNTIDLGIKHPNFASLLGAISPSAPRYDTLKRPANIDARIAINERKIKINPLKGSIGDTTLNGNITVDTGAQKPDITGDLTFSDVSIVSAGTAQAGGNDKPKSSGTSGAQKWPSTQIDSTWLNSANIDMRLKADRLVYETWDTRSPSIDFTLKDNVLNIKKLSAGLYGGTLALSTTLKPYTDAFKGYQVNADVVFNDVDMERLAGSFIGTKIINTNGKASLQTKLNGGGVSQRAIIQSLNGTGALNSDGQITIRGFDVAQFTRAMALDNKPGDTVAGLFKSAGQNGNTVFNTLKGGFDMKQGVMALQGVSLDGPTASVTSKGSIDLPQWYLNTTHTITAKGEGETLPTFDVVIKGPLDKPTQNIAQGALQNYLQQKVTRKLDKVLSDKLDLAPGEGPLEQKLFNKFVGDKLNEKLGIPARQPAQAPANTVSNPAPSQNTEAVTTSDTPASIRQAPLANDNTDQNTPAIQAEPQAAPADQPTAEEAIQGVLNSLFQ